MSSIRFIGQRDRYSIYEDRDGDEVYLAHGFPRVYLDLVDFDTDWMIEQWRRRKAIGIPLHGGEQEFLDWLRDHVFDPDMVDEVSFCERCEDPVHNDDGSDVEGELFACDDCIRNHYRSCTRCETFTQDATWTLSDDPICSQCRDDHYTLCEDCDGYYLDGDDGEHEHEDEDDEDAEDSCDCESPAQVFYVRNNGGGMLLLSNDEEVTVSLPAGTLDDEGLDRIVYYLRREGLPAAAALAEDLDRRWQTKEGNFTKRLSRAVYKKYQGTVSAKIPPAVLSQVGCIARDHSVSVDFTVAVTRDLNMSAADFYHDDSCWWASHSESRCALKTNGGFGLRTFGGAYDGVTGRAWVLPLKRLDEFPRFAPTFNTQDPDAFVVFNGYGDLKGYTAARIVSHMAGMTYRKISFSCGPMFINNDVGYLIAPEEIAADYTDDGSLTLRVTQHANLFDHENAAVKELASV